ncbi:IclR family transcriptional regulator [Bacillus sp. 1P10SD]|uniref:IclR family transcriptional regulator n=1 Tax=Bacillus sp. 1P10SD TaxID=3132265 RepID=UPI0039A75D7B
MSKEDSMQTISRAIQVLKAFSNEEKEHSLASLHQKLGLSKSSLQRILNTLIQHGLLDKDEKRKTYQLGIELYFLGHLVERNSHLMSIARPFMKELNDDLGETISLNIIHQKQRKCIGYLPSRHQLTTITYIGQYSPLFAGASAKLLLAYLPGYEITSYLNETYLEQITEKTIVDKDQLWSELKEIRNQGYSISHGERIIGAFSISAPIKNRFNEVIASLSLAMPTSRVDESETCTLINKLVNTSNLISDELR